MLYLLLYNKHCYVISWLVFLITQSTNICIVVIFCREANNGTAHNDTGSSSSENTVKKLQPFTH